MKVYVHRLGCPKNDVDADYILARLASEGHEPVSSPELAESIIVNTCGFILPAKQESINEIIRLGRLKKDGTLKRLYVSGCLAQRYGGDLLKGLPEIDGAFGLGRIDSIARALGDLRRSGDPDSIESRQLDYLAYRKRHLTDNFPYAYLKISDGCSRQCSYCAIPSIRGRYRSRPLADIVREAEFLASHGKKELILVSQEATLYGHDLKDGSDIIRLLDALTTIEQVRWIRLMYLHPSNLTPELIRYLVSGGKALPYFDLPLQHINSDVLKAMKRQVSRRRIENLLGEIRKQGDTAIIRTTFIVGFPGETGRQFRELVDFVAEYKFDRLGVFTYSREEDTAAAKLERQVSEKVKRERLDELMTVQQEIAFRRNRDLIGRTVEALVDSADGSLVASGRTRADCPEIDQEVRITGEGMSVGDFVEVVIESTDGYDLVGSRIRG
jgi:ribosomal protein S12 methylthiotransferase